MKQILRHIFKNLIPVSLTLGFSFQVLVGCAPGRQTLKEGKKEVSETQWIEQTLQRLTLKKKIGQMFFAAISGDHYAKGTSERERAEKLVRQAGVGGFHIWRGEPYATVALINHLQSLSKIPLLFEADFEHGTGWRFPGGVDFPSAMAIAATGDTTFAYQMGRITAIEGRSLGLDLTFAPVVDVNSNPYNPIINTRAFGETPEEVIRYTRAFIHGAHSANMLTTAKHFPGHGDTGMDSHLVLATIDADSSRLFSVELKPFEAAIQNGVDAIMSAHIYLKNWHGTPYTPSTLSPAILTSLLRKRLGFKGLVFTDAMGMFAVKHNFTEKYAAVAAVKAGADVILVPPNITAGIDAVVQAVGRGEITEARIDESVRRILKAKARAGLPLNKYVSPEKLPETLGTPQAMNIAREAAQKAITLLRNRGGLVPIHQSLQDSAIAVLMISDRPVGNLGQTFINRLRPALPGMSVDFLSDETAASCIEPILKRAKEASLVIMPVFAFVQAYQNGTQLSEPVTRAVQKILAGDVPVILISMGSPYIVQNFASVDAYLCTYGPTDLMQNAVANALLGRAPITGKSPVTLPGYFAKGDGIEVFPRTGLADIPVVKSAPRLRVGFPEEAGFSREGFARVDSLMEAAVRDSVFPGAVLLVAKDAIIAHFKSYGQMGYGEFSQPVPLNAIYDLASLTKVIATTTAAMLLVQKGKLNLDAPVKTYLPKFSGPEKDRVTVRLLLVHASGLPPFKRYFLENLSPGEIVQRILAEPLEYQPGEESRYSDLGIILLGKIIEKLTGMTLDQYCAQNIFKPLGMDETFFNPPEAFFKRIPPTEKDPWRGRVVHGVVHDENAFALGGVAGHAGLFSSAHDLAIFLQMLLNGGSYDRVSLLKPEIIKEFTQRQNIVPGSTRALGWDTRSEQNSSSGHDMSMKAFGHTGFTGTSVWVDPEKNLFVILLSNRVHPTRENHKIIRFRPKIHDAVMQALKRTKPND